MVSVIVPIYKVENYLARCVDSILAQTYKDLEIILVDDGSPDNSPSICDEYAKKDARIKVIHKVNGGLSSARNAGLDVAKGKYIAFVDSDDWVEPCFIETLVTALEETNADMSACKFCRTKGDFAKREWFDTNVEVIEGEKFTSIFTEKSYAGYACNKLFKNEIIQRNSLRYDEKIFNGEDFPFTTEYVFYANKVAYIKQDLYYYYFRETGIMNTISLTERFVTILYAREKTLEFLAENAPNVYDKCKASYLSILCKIKYMAMLDIVKHNNVLVSVNRKLKVARKGLFTLKNVALKDKLKLFIMIYFPKTMAKIYRKKVKVL